MIRFFFAFVLLVHGLIHMLGFVKEFQLGQVGQLTGKTLFPLLGTSAKVAGVLWLLACLLFVLAAILFLLKKEEWWMFGIVAVVVSQGLIVVYWPDAKFGSVANIIALLGIVLAYGSWNFSTMVRQEQKAFLLPPQKETIVVTEPMLHQLPPIVQKWLRRSQILGKEMIYTVHLKQKGEMRTQPDGNWMPVEAEQYFRVENPGFIWTADVQAAPFVHLAGRDKYENGHGHMLIKLLSLFPVADAQGEKIDQGTMLRYLGEMVWFPSAALQPYITWEAVDATTAKATMRYGGITASGVFRFNAEGDFSSLEAMRYYDRKTGPTLEKWLVTSEENSYKEFEGIRIPTKSAVTWKLKTGDFTWYKLEITDVHYNESNGRYSQRNPDRVPAVAVSN